MNKKSEMLPTNEEQQDRIKKVRLMFSNMYNFIEEACNKSRETSLSITKLEEAQFWAIKSISRESENNE